MELTLYLLLCRLFVTKYQIMDNGFQETMISTPKPISHSLSSKSLLYLNSRSLSSCGDLYLVSNDGFYFEINSAVFASVSGLSSVIRERADEFMILVTEVGQENLAKILLFCVSGVIRDVGDLSNPEVLQAFESLGIQLNTLNLSQERHNPAFEIHSPGAVPCQTLRAKLNVRPVPQKVEYFKKNLQQRNEFPIIKSRARGEKR